MPAFLLMKESVGKTHLQRFHATVTYACIWIMDLKISQNVNIYSLVMCEYLVLTKDMLCVLLSNIKNSILWIHTAAADPNNTNKISNCSIKYARIHRN